MDLLKAQFDRISKQLALLSSSQKMLTAALVAIMVMTLIWWGRYAGDPEMEPVLDQAFSAQDISRITAELASRGIHYTVSGDRILVPADRKFEVIASLSYAHLMPRDTASGFDEMMKNLSNPFNPDSTNEKLFNHGKEMMLSQIIQNFPNVAKADVMIDPTREVHVSQSIEPSATVTITMQDGEQANQQLVDAAADVVQGAQSGLARSRIKVVVGGVPRRLHDTDDGNDIDGAGSDVLELQQKAEVSRENQIKEYFSYISDLKVFVTVKVNPTSTQEHSQQFDPKKAVQKESETNNETTETTNSNPASGDPGLTTNGGLAVTGPTGGSGGSGSTETKEESKFQNFVSTTDTSTMTPAGSVSVVAASVRVPMAYFEAIFTRRNPDVKSPSDAQLQPLIEAELPKIRTDVMKCTGLTTEADVAVETYLDAAPIAVAAAQVPSALSVTTLVSGHSRDLVLGGLAIMSLFMVSMMVRKGTPALALPSMAAGPAAAAAGQPGTLNTEEALAGEVGGAGTMLNGMELDEGAVRDQQMLEQVSSMVKENPDAAATLVKRWMSRT
jgi:flagellar biosynthesis/type III secretory pathway M-ring protein FliF/YscJ